MLRSAHRDLAKHRRRHDPVENIIPPLLEQLYFNIRAKKIHTVTAADPETHDNGMTRDLVRLSLGLHLDVVGDGITAGFGDAANQRCRLVRPIMHVLL